MAIDLLNNDKNTCLREKNYFLHICDAEKANLFDISIQKYHKHILIPLG